MRRVEQRAGPKGGGRERPEIQFFSRLDIGHKDFHGAQFVNWAVDLRVQNCMVG